MALRPFEGIGLGLRGEFARRLIDTDRRIDFIEIVPENWLAGGEAARLLDRYAERWRLVPHSVSMSIGGPDPLDVSFIDAVARLCDRIGAPFWSDHISYSKVGGVYTHELLPLPFSEEAAAHTIVRIRDAAQRSPVPLVFENPTYYDVMPGSTLPETTFLRSILEETNSGMLLDVNNVYVNSLNHGFDAQAFIAAMPLDRVRQIHVAGHTRRRGLVVDTHAGPVPDEVWKLYRFTLARAGRLIPTVIEWDSEIPKELSSVLAEVDRARVEARVALSDDEARP